VTVDLGDLVRAGRQPLCPANQSRLAFETTLPVGPVDFNLELLLTISASPFGSIVFRSLPLDLTGPGGGC
jgi:hypothetical protein